MRSSKKQFFGPIVILLFGTLFFAIGSGLTLRQRSLESEGIAVQGTVVSFRERCDDEGCTYSPVVEFITGEGQNINFVSSYSSNPPSYKTGEAVTVIYQPDNPGKAVIKGEGQLLHIIFMSVGGIIILFGLYQVYTVIRDITAFGSGR